MKTSDFLTRMFLFVLLVIFTGSASGQNESTYYTISGIVKDSKSKDILAFATISVPGSNIGTVTNSDGEFTLKVQKSLNAKEFEISHLGYVNKKFPALEGQREDQIFYLDPYSITLKEVIVRPEDPRRIVMLAINKISDNYSQKPNMMTGFYRETIRQRRDYVSISEAIVNIYKAPYGFNFDNDRVKIFKGRRSANVKKSDTLSVKLLGGPHVSLLLDIVKNPESLISRESADFYSYELVDVVNINNATNYVIEFKPIVNLSYPLYYGKLYISVDRLAFTMAEFSLDISDESKAVQSFVKKKPLGLRFVPTATKYLVYYKEQDGLNYISYVRNEIKFSCDWKRRIFKTNYTIMSELAITERRTDNIEKYTLRESFNPSSILAEKVQDYFDPNYWGEYNTIEPDQSIEKAIEKMNKRYKRMQ